MKIRFPWMSKAFLGMLAALMLAGCESMYYDMVMDKSMDSKAGGEKEDSLAQANNINRLGSYR